MPQVESAGAAAPVPAWPTQAALRVQGVGDLVEGHTALQARQQRGQHGACAKPQEHHQQQNPHSYPPPSSSSWCMEGLGSWRSRAFAGTEAADLVRQQQREVRRMLLRNSAAEAGAGSGGTGSSSRRGGVGGADAARQFPSAAFDGQQLQERSGQPRG